MCMYVCVYVCIYIYTYDNNNDIWISEGLTQADPLGRNTSLYVLIYTCVYKHFATST